MSEVKFTIPGQLIDLNKYLNQAEKHWGKRSQLKAAETQKAQIMAQNNRKALKEIELPLDIHVNWVCKDRRKDKDNIRFAMKFILDGLEAANIIPNDGWGEIGNLSDSFSVDKDNPRVEVIVS